MMNRQFRPAAKKMKYIVIQNYWTGASAIDTIFVFPNYVQHVDFARALLSGQMTDPEIKVIGAGFCYGGDELNRPSCFGDSVSLNIKSRVEQDTTLLRMMMEDDY